MDFKSLFSFEGRYNRAKYWGEYLLVCLVLILVYAVLFGIYGIAGSNNNSIIMVIVGTFFMAFYIAFFWIILAQMVKRLHDLDKSGWLFLVLFIPLINLVLAIYICFIKGTEGENQFGPDPLAK